MALLKKLLHAPTDDTTIYWKGAKCGLSLIMDINLIIIVSL